MHPRAWLIKKLLADGRFAVVPRNPNEKMLKAAKKAMHKFHQQGGGHVSDRRKHSIRYMEMVRAYDKQVANKRKPEWWATQKELN